MLKQLYHYKIIVLLKANQTHHMQK